MLLRVESALEKLCRGDNGGGPGVCVVALVGSPWLSWGCACWWCVEGAADTVDDSVGGRVEDEVVGTTPMLSWLVSLVLRSG